MLASVAAGELAPSQGAELVAAISALARLVDVDELAARIEALERLNHAGMSAVLAGRIEALEAMQLNSEGRVIFLSGAAHAGQPKAPVIAIVCSAQRWVRLDGETVEALRERATRECERNAWGIALLSECTASSPEQPAPTLRKIPSDEAAPDRH